MIDVCFWCNREKGGDKEGDPLYNDYNFCHDCLVEVRKGITVMQVTELGNGNPPITDGLFPTGRWIVINIENVKKLLADHPQLNRVLVTKKMYINTMDWEAMNLP